MALPPDKNDEYFNGSRIFGPTNICFIRYHQLFLWKTKRKAVLETIEDFQKNIGGGVRFYKVSLVCCYSEN